MQGSPSKPRATQLLSTMIDGYTPAINKALDGKSPKSPDINVQELRDLLNVWEDIRVYLSQGNGV